MIIPKGMILMDLKIIRKLVNEIPEIKNNLAIDKAKTLAFIEETIKKYEERER